MYHNAKEGNVFILTQKGYEATPGRVKKEREVGQPLKGYEQAVPESWIRKGYVEEQAEKESLHDRLTKFQKETEGKKDVDIQRQREDKQLER